jgi:hypothetical protein
VIIRGEPMDAYHAHPAVSASMLRDFMRLGPRGYWARYVARKAPGYDSTALAMGRAFDDLIFEPEAWSGRCTVKPEGHNGRTKEGKAWAAEQEAAGRVVLAQEDVETLYEMERSLRNNTVAAALLEAGEYQVTLRVPRDPFAALQARPDVLGLEAVPESGFRAFDLNVKTTSSLDRWPSEIYRLGYHVQVGVTDLCLRAMGHESTAFALGVVEKCWPYRCQVYWLSDAYVEAGATVANRELHRLAAHYEADHWPLVDSDEVHVEPPRWLMEREGMEAAE